MNLAVVNDMYSGIKAPRISPTKTIACEMIKATFRPNLSETYPNTYDPISKAHIVNVAVKNTCEMGEVFLFLEGEKMQELLCDCQNMTF